MGPSGLGVPIKVFLIRPGEQTMKNQMTPDTGSVLLGRWRKRNRIRIVTFNWSDGRFSGQ